MVIYYMPTFVQLYKLYSHYCCIFYTVDTAGQKAENKQWIEEELHRANSLTPGQMKDDWYIMLELPKYTQIGQPALPSSGTPKIATIVY